MSPLLVRLGLSIAGQFGYGGYLAVGGCEIPIKFLWIKTSAQRKIGKKQTG